MLLLTYKIEKCLFIQNSTKILAQIISHIHTHDGLRSCEAVEICKSLRLINHSQLYDSYALLK